MQENLHKSPAISTSSRGSSWMTRLLSSAILERLGGITGGWVRLNWRGEQYILGDTSHPSTPIDMHIHNDQFFTTLATRGSIGAAELHRASTRQASAADQAGQPQLRAQPQLHAQQQVVIIAQRFAKQRESADLLGLNDTT